MNGRRIAALVRRVVLEIRRDRPSLALLFVAPILITGLVSFILREGQTPVVRAAIVNEAGSPGAMIATLLGGALDRQGGILTTAPDEASARTLVRSGSATIAIVLPAGVGSASAPAIILVTDGLDPSGDASQVGALQKAILSAVSAAGGGHLPTIEHETIYGTPSEDPVATFAPAILGFFAYFFVYILTGVSFLRERTGGTLERLLATPVTRAEIVLGYTLGFGLFATLQVGVLMVWALGTLDVPATGPLAGFSIGLGIAVAGNPLIAFLVVGLLAVGAVSLGIFLSTFARTELQIIQFIPIVLAPQFLLSGVLFPVGNLPDVLQPLVRLMPLNYAVDGLRQVFTRGAGLDVGALQGDIAVLAVVAAFFAAIAALTIRREVA